MSTIRKVVVTAYASPAAGPGWANSPLWVILRDGDGHITEECVQPDEQTAEQQILYRISAAIHRDMVRAEERRRANPRKRKR